MYFEVNQIEILKSISWYWEADVNGFYTLEISSGALIQRECDYHIGVI